MNLSSRERVVLASFLMVFGSVSAFWVISFWFPLPDYLAAIGSQKYSQQHTAMQILIATYLCFTVLNLVFAGLILAKIPKLVTFLIILLPACWLLLCPFILAIPIALQHPKSSYFEVLQAFFALFRFTTLEAYSAAITMTVVAFILNAFASVLVWKTQTPSVFPKNRVRGFSITAAIVLTLALILVGTFTSNSNQRAMDRGACTKYAALQIPDLDNQVPTYLNEVTLYGQEAGSGDVRSAFEQFAKLSRQYFQLLNSEQSQDSLDQYQLLVASAKDSLASVCSQYSTE